MSTSENTDYEANGNSVRTPLAGAHSTVRPHIQQHPVANPDDPPVHRPPRGPQGPLPGPHYLGIEGRTAIVQGQVFLVAIILIAQLGLVTDALYELLSGHPNILGWLTLASGLGFVLALIITFWPRRRIEEV
jgi:hypothetical protein